MEYKWITKNEKKVVIYTRVSTSNQKDDLKNQVQFLKQYANSKGMIVDEIIEDYGSGLNYNRKLYNGYRFRIKKSSYMFKWKSI